MERLEPRLWADARIAGTLYTTLGVGLAAAVGAGLDAAAPHASVAVCAYVAVASRNLCDAAGEVRDALASGDLEDARIRLRSLVGRQTDTLDEKEIVRATVESVAENTVDAVTAPVLWALYGGGAGALGYRAVNTLDAMVGHHTPRYERFGWAAARSDDLANWIPARLTAAAVAAVRPARARAIWAAVRHQAPGHPSPNAGVAEAAFAAALGIRLGGTNVYAGRVEVRPELGTGPPPQKSHIDAACRLSRHTSVAVLAAAAAVSAARARRGRS
jgi:adenosylcobinamide-phosphate synthase